MTPRDYVPNMDKMRHALEDEKEWKAQRSHFINTLFIPPHKSLTVSEKKHSRRIPRELIKQHLQIDIHTYSMSYSKDMYDQLCDKCGMPDDIHALPEYIINAVRKQFK